MKHIILLARNPSEAACVWLLRQREEDFNNKDDEETQGNIALTVYLCPHTCVCVCMRESQTASFAGFRVSARTYRSVNVNNSGRNGSCSEDMRSRRCTSAFMKLYLHRDLHEVLQRLAAFCCWVLISVTIQ